MNIFLIDADNLNTNALVDEAFHLLEVSEGVLPVRRAYGSAENLKTLSESLRTWAVRPFVNLSLTKNTTDMALAVDAMELACQTPTPKLIVIGSGDADFVPLVVRLRERGIRVLCISERNKMAREAVSAYDRVTLVGQEQALHEARLAAVAAVEALEALEASRATSATPKKIIPAAPIAPIKLPAPAVSDVVAPLTPVPIDDPASVRAILAALPDWLPNTIMQLSQLGTLLRDSDATKGSKPLHELFRKHPLYFKVLPTAGPAQQVRLLQKPR